MSALRYTTILALIVLAQFCCTSLRFAGHTVLDHNSQPSAKGTALTIVNCIDFAITIVSIQLLVYLLSAFNSPWVYTVLGAGSLFGLITMVINKKTPSTSP